MTMSNYVDRLEDYYRAIGKDYVALAGTLWTLNQRMIVSTSPVCRDDTITPSEQHALLSHFKKAVLVRYTDGFSANADTANDPGAPWYVVACNRFVKFEEFNSHFRNKLRKGMKMCSVEKVDSEYIAAHGYDVFMAAFDRYRNAKRPSLSKAEFVRKTLATKDYPDLWEYWVVRVENEVAGYAVNLINDQGEAGYNTLKFDPRFLKAYSSYALHFRMNDYYLNERAMSWVVNGFRSIGHNTYIQDLLVDYFGFRRVPTNLFVCYRPWTKAALCLPRFAKGLIGRIAPQYAALCKLDEAKCRV